MSKLLKIALLFISTCPLSFMGCLILQSSQPSFYGFFSQKIMLIKLDTWRNNRAQQSFQVLTCLCIKINPTFPYIYVRAHRIAMKQTLLIQVDVSGRKRGGRLLFRCCKIGFPFSVPLIEHACNRWTNVYDWIECGENTVICEIT